jgi:antitoxin (DNA-binding transcriptional repressor) of toxin-antitoxin stability system
MEFVSLRDLKINPSKVVGRLRKGDLIVTRNGKPAAALVYLNEELLEDFVLVHHPTLLGEVESAKAEYLKKGGMSHEAMWKRLKRRRG